MDAHGTRSRFLSPKITNNWSAICAQILVSPGNDRSFVSKATVLGGVLFWPKNVAPCYILLPHWDDRTSNHWTIQRYHKFFAECLTKEKMTWKKACFWGIMFRQGLMMQSIWREVSQSCPVMAQQLSGLGMEMQIWVQIQQLLSGSIPLTWRPCKATKSSKNGWFSFGPAISLRGFIITSKNDPIECAIKTWIKHPHIEEWSSIL